MIPITVDSEEFVLKREVESVETASWTTGSVTDPVVIIIVERVEKFSPTRIDRLTSDVEKELFILS